MKKKIIIAMCLLGGPLVVLSCGDQKSTGSGSATETTATDSSGAPSRAAMGQDEGKQKEMNGFPSNQSNLGPDSVSKKHDPDTTHIAPPKDKPAPHKE